MAELLTVGIYHFHTMKSPPTMRGVAFESAAVVLASPRWRRPFMTTAEKVFEKLKSAPPALAQEVLDFVEFLVARRRKPATEPPRSFDEFFGVLKGSKVFDGDPVEIQRKQRDEWA
jgi:hypothetical protein